MSANRQRAAGKKANKGKTQQKEILDWDIDRLKTEHECDEHWQLRRLFLLKHKDKFPEDRLICLAQVFINIEILGCRYPQETMDLVSTLSQGIVESFREKRKSKLQIFFVHASDAAESKYNQNSKRTCDVKGTKGIQLTSFQLATEDTGFSTHNPGANKKQRTQEEYSNPVEPSVQSEIPDNPFENIIIVSNKGMHASAWQTLERSLQLSGFRNEDSLMCVLTTLKNNNFLCEVFIKGVCHGRGVDLVRNVAKDTASEIVLEKMKEYCYSIIIKTNFVSDKVVDRTLSGKVQGNTVDEPIADTNMGNKLLRMMGWSGGGLGKNQQGIEAPIKSSSSVNRNGLGLQNMNNRESQQKITQLLHDFMTQDFTDSTFEQDLVFSSDFTNEERCTIHKVARKFGLKSKSYGKNEDRHLVVSMKESLKDILNRLLQSGSTEKYDLIKPKLLL